MTAVKIGCGSCGQCWPQARPLSVYEREVLESRPCPHCGAYTLAVQESRPARKGRKPDRIVATPTAGKHHARLAG